MIDRFNGMSTHWGRVMPKRTMLKFIEKCVNVYSNLKMIKFKVCLGDLTYRKVLI